MPTQNNNDNNSRSSRKTKIHRTLAFSFPSEEDEREKSTLIAQQSFCLWFASSTPKVWWIRRRQKPKLPCANTQPKLMKSKEGAPKADRLLFFVTLLSPCSFRVISSNDSKKVINNLQPKEKRRANHNAEVFGAWYASRLKNWVLFMCTDGITWQIFMPNAKSSNPDEKKQKRKKRCETIGFCLPHRKFRCLWAICMYEHKLHKQPSKIISGTSTNTQSPRISFGKSVKTLLTASKISFFKQEMIKWRLSFNFLFHFKLYIHVIKICATIRLTKIQTGM